VGSFQSLKARVHPGVGQKSGKCWMASLKQGLEKQQDYMESAPSAGFECPTRRLPNPGGV